MHTHTVNNNKGRVYQDTFHFQKLSCLLLMCVYIFWGHPVDGMSVKTKDELGRQMNLVLVQDQDPILCRCKACKRNTQNEGNLNDVWWIQMINLFFFFFAMLGGSFVFCFVFLYIHFAGPISLRAILNRKRCNIISFVKLNKDKIMRIKNYV